MMHLFANFDPYHEVWVGKVEGLPIDPTALRAATLDELVAKVWVMIGDSTEDDVGGLQLIVTMESGLLETMHLRRSPANRARLEAALADIAAGRVIKRDL
jgi:hypothetical protein